MKTIKNALPEPLFAQVESAIERFNYVYSPFTSHKGDKRPDTCQMVARIDGQPLSDALDSMFRILCDIPAEYKLHRMKANILFNNADAPLHNPPHIDVDNEHISVLYYVNESDGCTFFFDNDFNVKAKIRPQANKLVYWSERTWHASQNPVETQARFVINTVYTK